MGDDWQRRRCAQRQSLHVGGDQGRHGGPLSGGVLHYVQACAPRSAWYWRHLVVEVRATEVSSMCMCFETAARCRQTFPGGTHEAQVVVAPSKCVATRQVQGLYEVGQLCEITALTSAGADT